MTHKDRLLIGLILLSLALGLLLWRELRKRDKSDGSGPRILFPFDDHTFSMSSLEVTMRIALAEKATLVPAYLAVVPMRVGLDGALPRKVKKALPMLDAIELRATKLGVRVDSRIEPGRSYRHALKRTFAQEQLDQVVIAAGSETGNGFRSDDIAWMLDHSEVELLILKAAPDSKTEDPILHFV